jgi:alkanesulfonate monooxygenase SsuD/methylene tetrahydromethanopterin reductase-like flavin-dependent oxidoreductase (luciferase family)
VSGSPTDPPRVARFGIMTAPQQVDYSDLLRVWREADTVPAIEHAWLVDHPMPIGGDPLGPTYEGWTLLSALAAQTQRLQLGVLVTSNRFRPPAMLAKIAATVDVVSAGRLVLGIGAGSRPAHPLVRREYEAHGLPFFDRSHAVGGLAEACTVIRRLWNEPDPFDFQADYVRLAGAFCNPKPVQRPSPPILIGGRSGPLLRVAAEHADVWNIAGSDIEDCVERSALLDRYCDELGRDPGSITRSIHLGTTSRRSLGPRSTRRSMPASTTSSSRSRLPTHATWRSGSPERSSTPSRWSATARRRHRRGRRQRALRPRYCRNRTGGDLLATCG